MKPEQAEKMNGESILLSNLYARMIVAFIDLYITSIAYNNYIRDGNYQIDLSGLLGTEIYTIGREGMRNSKVQQLAIDIFLKEGWSSVKFYTDQNPPTVVLQR